jgi:hypothetical protein
MDEQENERECENCSCATAREEGRREGQKSGYAEGRREERADTLTWLSAIGYFWFAAAIERGDHVGSAGGKR